MPAKTIESNPYFIVFQNEFGWLVRLSGELVEREQLVRTAQIVSLQLGVTPQLQGCFPYPRTCEQLLQEIRSVASQRSERTAEWLWSKLPSHWQQPVELHDFRKYI